MSHHARIAITKASFPCAHRLDDANRFCRFIVDRNQTLFLGFSSRNAQPCCPIRVLIQAINRESANFIPSSSTPTSNEQCCPLKRALQGPNRLHEPTQLIGRNVTRNTEWCLWEIPRAEQRTARDIFPSPSSRLAEKEREAGKTTYFTP